MTKLAQGMQSAGATLVVCHDPPVLRMLVQSLRHFALVPEVCGDVFSATSLLNRRKFEAVIIDFGLGEEAGLVMEHLRLSRSNRTGVTLGIAGENESGLTTKPGTTFVFERPLTTASVRNTLRAAYGLVVRERRRYYRCPLDVSAFIRSEQREEVSCRTVNVSEAGMAVAAPVRFNLGLQATIRFGLPEQTRQFSAEAKICWCDDGGYVGLEFNSLAATQKAELQEWLARKLDENLPEAVAAQFRDLGRF